MRVVNNDMQAGGEAGRRRQAARAETVCSATQRSAAGAGRQVHSRCPPKSVEKIRPARERKRP